MTSGQYSNFKSNQYFLVQNHLVVTFSSKPTDSFHFQLPVGPLEWF